MLQATRHHPISTPDQIIFRLLLMLMLLLAVPAVADMWAVGIRDLGARRI